MKTFYQRLRRRTPTEFLPESIQFFNRLVANGGTISNNSMAAVDQFVRTLLQREVWHRLTDAGVFVGDQLAGGLVKLKACAGTPGVLTNQNFVAGDYLETGANGGLLGNGTTKCLRTGVSGTALAVTGHLSFYVRENLPSTGYHALMGASSMSDEFSLSQGLTTVKGTYGQALTTSTSDLTRGFLCVVRAGATDLRLYRNGAQVDANSTSAAVATPSADVAIFASNADGSLSSFLNVRGSFYSIGQPLGAGDVATLYDAVQILQTALNRAV